MYKYLYKIYQIVRFRHKKFPISPLVFLKQLGESESWDRDRMEAYQLEKINELLRDAKENTPFYKKRITKELSSIKSLEEFKESFPTLTKKDIRTNVTDLVNHKEENVHPHSTSGSTGTPIVAIISGMAQSLRLAGIMRFYSWWGIEQFDKNVLIWGRRKTQKKETGILAGIKRKFLNRLEINVFELNKDTVLKYVENIIRFNPTYIRGYPSGLYTLSKLMGEQKLTLRKVKLKVIIVTGEILYDYQRTLIEDTFKCKVANEYGSAECGLYAHECPEGSLHINEESVFIHTDDKNNSIVTELHNNGMPLINYVNNDRLEISNDYCSCGRTSRLVKKISGRVSDYIIAPDGSEITDGIFYYIIAELADVNLNNSVIQYKVYQNKNDFLVEIVAGENYKVEVANYIEKRMKEQIDEKINVNIKLVEAIKRDKSGKLRVFVQNS